MSERTDRLKYLGEIALMHWRVRANGAKLDISVERPMAGPGGLNYTADIVLEDRSTGFPRVAYAVLDDSAQDGGVAAQLGRLDGTRKYLTLIDRSAPGPVELRVLAPKRLRAQAEAAIAASGTDALAEVY